MKSTRSTLLVMFVIVIGLLAPIAVYSASPPAIGVVTDATTIAFADRMKTGRATWDSPTGFGDGTQTQYLNAQGWPTHDCSNIVWEGVNDNDGTYTIQFNGLAHLSASYGYATFSPQNANGTTGNYNASTNTTTATMVVTDTGYENFSLVFTNTQSTQGAATNTGVTNIQVMRPISEGSSTSYTPLSSTTVPSGSNTFTAQFVQLESPFKTLRFLNWDGANNGTQVNWTDRVLPTHANQGSIVAWEYMIMLCNYTGKDCYINIPVTCSNAYITTLANLFAYGSDSNGNVYTSTQTNPYYPPLNSSLNLYIEWGNEVWNGSFTQFNQNLAATQADIANAPDAELSNINYDNQNVASTGGGNYNNQYLLAFRRIAERIKDTSDLFRAVFPTQMPDSTTPRIRPVLEWQYNNQQDTSDIELNYLDNWYNNGDLIQNFATPEPPSHYLYGGGGATYFDSSNDDGFTTLLSDGSFMTPAVTGYAADPTGGSWSFSGTAGIAANGSSINNPVAPYRTGPAQTYDNYGDYYDVYDPNTLGGTQVAYIQGTGSFSQSVTFPSAPTSSEYAFEFRAVGPSGATNLETFNVYLDNTNASNLLGTFTPPAFIPGTLYPTSFPYYVTTGLVEAKLAVTPGSTHTLLFVGTGTSSETAFIDSVTLTSTDAIYASGLPAAQYQSVFNTEVDWAAAFGLHDIAYESGWALQSLASNGWESGSNVTQAAKYDARSTAAAINAENEFVAAGGVLNLYLQSYASAYDDIWAFTTSDTNLTTPLYEAIDSIVAESAPSITNGTVVPATITAPTISASLDTPAWNSYNLLVNTAGTYYIGALAAAGSSGTMYFYLDNVLLGSTTSPNNGLTVQYSASIGTGLHVVKVKGSGFTVSYLDVTSSPYPAAPTNFAVTPGNGSALLTWTPPSGSVTGYNIYRGTASGGEGNTPYATLSATTAYTDTAATNGTTYYYYVVAVNNGQSGNRTPELSALPGLIINPGFETGNESGWGQGGYVNGVNSVAPHSGTYAAYNNGSYNSLYQNITGLLPNTTYTLTAWGRLINAGGNGTNAWFYVDNYNGSASVTSYITSTAYAKSSLVFTTGLSSTTCQIDEVMDGSTTIGSYFDDFALTQTASTPTFSPAAGTYSGPQTVTISSPTTGANIYYTTNGTAATTSSTLYTGPVTVSSTETLNAVAGSAPVFGTSSDSSAGYTISGSAAATPTFSPAPGNYTSSQSVTITDSTSGATIYYTTNGTTPTTSSTKYTGPIVVNTTTTIEAIAAATGYANSAVALGTYTITLPTAATPTFSPVAGTYSSAQSVTISDSTTGSTIYYTTNGTTPTTSSTRYTAAIPVSTTTTVEAIAAATGYTNSAVGTAVYTISSTTATPTFSPVGGTYTAPQTVTLADSTTGASIYYTTNGTTPTTSSTKYTSAISVPATTTIKALAAASGYLNSSVATAVYTINLPTAATPIFSPAAGSFTTSQSVTIADSTPGVTIYYTTNGTTPTTSSTKYTGVIAVSLTTTLKAMALATGYVNSAVASATYTIPASSTEVLTLVPGNGSMYLTWTVPSGTITSYQVWRGTFPGGEGQTPYVSGLTGTSYVNSGLANGTVYYYFIEAMNGTTMVAQSTEVSGAPGYFLNPGFETGTLAGWSNGGYNLVVNSVAPHSGTYACNNEGYYNSVFQTIPNLRPNTTYVATCWGRLQNTGTTNNAWMYVNSFGGTEIDNYITTTSYSQYSITFTTGSSNTSAQIGEVMDGSTTIGSYVDDFSLTPVTTAPTFSPAAGTYSSAQTVTINSPIAGASIFYTTNGSTPTPSSTLYTGPISVTSSETINAIIVVPGYITGSPISATYTIT